MANTGQYDSQTNIETEDYEREIFVRPEAAVIYGGSVVNSVNGQVGDVILTTSDLENTSDYQTGAQVQNAIAGKQDKLTAGSGLNLDGTILSVDTNIIATVQDVTDEATIRENSDANLQGQIDALTVSSDVIDVLGTYQDLQNYDTSHVKANDIIKVLQDSTHNNSMSYYRWEITDHAGSWVYVGSEGPYYTKSEADALLDGKQNVIVDLPQIRSGAEAGATAVQPEDLARIATTGSYNDSLDKPSINNVALIGNISLDALGIQPKGNYALESEIPDVSNFITNTVDNLVNYYKKSETFTKQEVNDLISAITTMDIRVVQTLPTEDISTTTIYFVPKTTAGTNDVYDEYVYVSNAWEHIGSTDIDLSGYQTKIDSSHKLSSDLVDDTNQTNKFVTENEKTTWNTEIENLQEEDELLKRNLQTTTGSGEEVTLDKTAELDFVKPPLPRGNSEQEGEPSPDNEVPITNVTGNVEVTISNENNTESKTLPVSLGNIELCKIGNYQDYLYKNNGKWYVHKNIIKIDLSTITNYIHTSGWRNPTSFVADNVFYHEYSGYTTVASLFCNRLIADTPARITGSVVNAIGLGRNSSIYLSVEGITTSNALITYFSQNPTYLYAPLATPTDTEITDTTLISQLEAISKTLSYQGQTNITSNTIALFDVEAYQDLKIILEDISNELDTIYKAFPTDTASGAVASFTDGADNLPLKSLVVNIDPIQDTSQGDPSPENVCPISGWTGMQLNANGTVIPISWQTEAGTVYGGTLDVTTGVLTVDRAMVDLGAKNWYSSTAAGRTRFRTSITDIERISSPNIVAPILCSNYPTKTANQTYQGTTGVSLQQNEADIYIYDPQTESMTTAEFKSAMSGVQLCYKLATPIEIQLAPHELNTLLGVNNIWANTGDTEVEYRADTKLYINKMIGDAETISTRLASGGRETALYKGAINPIETNIPLEEEGVEYEKT